NGVIGLAGGGGHSLALLAPVPNVTKISPQTGPTAGGTSVTITGTNLGEATAVHFGPTAAASMTVNSATSITAVSPAGSGTVNVTVTNQAGTGAITLKDQFSYGAAPKVTKVEPKKGPAAGGTAVTITGVDLTGATAVAFGPTPAASFTGNSATSI